VAVGPYRDSNTGIVIPQARCQKKGAQKKGAELVVEIKTPAEVEAMRGAGRVVAQILAAIQDQAKAGMRTAELDEIARDVLARNGAYSPFLNYQPGFAPVPFPATICTSVNDAALHGIPGQYKLADGDLLSVDCGAVLDGWTAAGR
jgi:methionyl aminopeptidase